MENGGIWKQIGLGTLAGIAGTMAIQGMMTANHKLLPAADPPVRRDPGEFMLKKAKEILPQLISEKISGRAADGVSTLLAVGYGSTGAVLYTALRSDPNTMLDGAALGAAVWAVGYLGWMPALKLMPPLKEHTPAQIASSLAQHVVYGIATIAAFRKLKSALS